MQKFCIWDLLIFFRDSIAPSLKVIYESWACGKSRNSPTKVKLPFKKKRQKPLQRLELQTITKLNL